MQLDSNLILFVFICFCLLLFVFTTVVLGILGVLFYRGFNHKFLSAISECKGSSKSKVEADELDSLRNEIPYDTMRTYLELNNLLNYNGKSDSQCDLDVINQFYGKE